MPETVEKYREYYFDTVKKLLLTPSPSGYYREVMKVVKELAEAEGCEFYLTRKGCGVITVPGRDRERAVGACAHCDTLGAMVRSVDSAGGINFTTVGGPSLPSLDGEYCTVITRDGRKYGGTFLSKSPAVHVYRDSGTRARDCDNMYVRLDETVKSADDVKALGIENGDYICFDPKTTVTESGFLKSRFIDDKASVACLLTAVHIMHDSGFVPETDIVMLVTMYEEVGHGASALARDIDEFVTVDMGCVGLDLAGSEYAVSICAKDSGGPYHYDVVRGLIAAAEKMGAPYAVDVYPRYGSDVEATLRAGYDIRHGLIGSGVYASHGYERSHVEGALATLKTLIGYVG